MSQDQQETCREMCFRCFRAAKVCICQHIPSVANKTGVIVLQHHRERLHPIGTARIARLGFQQVSVLIAKRQQALHCQVDPPPKTGLLYPGPTSTDLAVMQPEQCPENLVVIDGTWLQAKQLYKSNTWLHNLPRYCLKRDQPSQYRIRRQPGVECLSTIEALVHAMKLIEPETKGLDELLDVFNLMVDRQIDYRDQKLTGDIL